MGIRGLTSYIQGHAEYFLQDYELRDTFLVIDGCNFAHQIYWNYMKPNEAFGGDYDSYANCIQNFFQDLINCKVKPLVFLDGSFESRKTKTKMTRFHDRYKSARNNFPWFQIDDSCCRTFFPAFGYTVFKNVMEEMNIKYVQCLFEADHAIAGVAKLLQCPVLSLDSDFFIYGSSYIPFDTLKWKKKRIKCLIYKVEFLIGIFTGLVDEKLPLAAMLIGNDYVERQEFDTFYHVIKKQERRKMLRCENELQHRIQNIFQWLAQQKIQNIIPYIINYIPIGKKTRLLKTMEMIINEYTDTSDIPIPILLRLGFSQKYINDISKRSESNGFKKGLIDSIHELIKNYEHRENYKFENLTDKDIIDKLPHWFLDEFYKGLLPGYFLCLLVHRKYLYPAQAEDYNQPSSVFLSQRIINVIDTLLNSGFKNSNETSYLLTRGPDSNVDHFPLEYIDDIGVDKIPSLYNLREIPLTTRKCIYDSTLNIKQHDLVNKFPENWKLYITAIKYWIDNLSLSSNIHIYALLFAMLQYVIDIKIGFYKSIKSFKSKFCDQLQIVGRVALSEKQEINYFSILDEDSDTTIMINQIKEMDLSKQLHEEKSITELINEITLTDCLMLAPFFISYSDVHPKIQKNKKLYKPVVVHIFTQFKNCLRHSKELNALLGNPYENPKICSMFNGTLIYNLHESFNRRRNVENYIKLILQNSPGFVRLFDTMLAYAKLLFNFKVNVPKK